MQPIPEAVAWAERADAWAAGPDESQGGQLEKSRWSDSAATGRPAFPEDGVGWRSETAEWRATEQTARWRQTTEWRSTTGSHGWRSTTEAWHTGAGSENLLNQVGDSQTGQPLAITGTPWTPTPGDEVAQTDQSDTTRTWQTTDGNGNTSWHRVTGAPAEADPRPACQQFAPQSSAPAWQPTDRPSATPSWQGFVDPANSYDPPAQRRPTWDTQGADPSGGVAGAAMPGYDPSRHLVREDDRDRWRRESGMDDGYGGRRQAADPRSNYGGTGWSTRSEADNWAGHADTGSIQLFNESGLAAAADAPSWRTPQQSGDWRTGAEQNDGSQSPPSWRTDPSAPQHVSSAPAWNPDQPDPPTQRAGDAAAPGSWQSDDARTWGTAKRGRYESPVNGAAGAGWRTEDPAAESRRGDAQRGAEDWRAEPGAGGWQGQPGTSGSGWNGGQPGTGGYGSQPGANGYGGQPGAEGYGQAGANGWGGQAGANGWGGQAGANGYGGQPGTGGYLGGQAGTNGYPSGQPGANGWGGGRAGQPGADDSGGNPWRSPQPGTTGWAGQPGTNQAGGNPWRSGQSGANGTGQPGPNGWAGQPSADEAAGNSWGGQPGSNGYGGQPGPNGYGGQPGANGYGGQPGPNGYGGQPGPNGYGGQPGPNGYSGQPSPNGYAGQPSEGGRRRRAADDGTRLPNGAAAAIGWRPEEPPAQPWRGDGQASDPAGNGRSGQAGYPGADDWRGQLGPRGQGGQDQPGRREASEQDGRDGGRRRRQEPQTGRINGAAAAIGWRPEEPPAEPMRREDGPRPDPDSWPGQPDPRGRPSTEDWRGQPGAEDRRGQPGAEDWRGEPGGGYQGRGGQRGAPSGDWRDEPGQGTRDGGRRRRDYDEPPGRQVNGAAAIGWRGEEAAQEDWRRDLADDYDGRGPRRNDPADDYEDGRPRRREDPAARPRSGPAAPRSGPAAPRSGPAAPRSGPAAIGWRGEEPGQEDWRRDLADDDEPDGRRRNNRPQGRPDEGRQERPDDGRQGRSEDGRQNWRQAEVGRPAWQDELRDDVASRGDNNGDVARRRDDDGPRRPRNGSPREIEAGEAETGYIPPVRPDSGARSVGRARPSNPNRRRSDADGSDATLGPETWQREQGSRPQGNGPEPARDADWRGQLRAETAGAETEIRRVDPEDWQREQAARSSGGYRGGTDTGDWRRELAAESALKDGEAQRDGTQSFVPFKPVGTASVPQSPPVGPISPAPAPREPMPARPEDTQWPPRRPGGYENSSNTGSYERRPARSGGLATAEREPTGLLEPDEDELDEVTGGPLAAVGYTVGWYTVPVVLFLLYYVIMLNGTEQARAQATLISAAPQFGLSLLLSVGIAVGLRWASGTWKAASVGLAAAVMGGGLATVLISAITGNSLS